MRYFSWITSDTKRAINVGSNSTIYMLSPDGRKFKEEKNQYKGYGFFGGKDIYELIAEINGIKAEDVRDMRREGISITFTACSTGEFGFNKRVKYPILIQDKNDTYEESVEKYGYPQSDPEHGAGKQEKDWYEA